MSLFLVMKRYKTNLKNYLKENDLRAWRTSLIIFTQILEGLGTDYKIYVIFLNRNKSLKSTVLMLQT